MLNEENIVESKVIDMINRRLLIVQVFNLNEIWGRYKQKKLRLIKIWLLKSNKDEWESSKQMTRLSETGLAYMYAKWPTQPPGLAYMYTKWLTQPLN